MAQLSDITTYCHTLLNVDKIADYCPNGLQVAGSSTIHKIISGVTANQLLIAEAIEQKADAILVHHGYFWKNENPCLVGMKGERIRQLIMHNINLIAYHLPLDLHTSYGNNALWGKKMGWQGQPTEIDPTIFYCDLGKPLLVSDLHDQLVRCLNRPPLHLSGGHKTVSRIAWCSGAAQNFIEKALCIGADVFMSGEVSEPTMHIAKEMNIEYFACGHHATEIFGVRALGEHLAEKFSLEHRFINIHNPV